MMMRSAVVEKERRYSGLSLEKSMVSRLKKLTSQIKSLTEKANQAFEKVNIGSNEKRILSVFEELSICLEPIVNLGTEVKGESYHFIFSAFQTHLDDDSVDFVSFISVYLSIYFALGFPENNQLSQRSIELANTLLTGENLAEMDEEESSSTVGNLKHVEMKLLSFLGASKSLFKHLLPSIIKKIGQSPASLVPLEISTFYQKCLKLSSTFLISNLQLLRYYPNKKKLFQSFASELLPTYLELSTQLQIFSTVMLLSDGKQQNEILIYSLKEVISVILFEDTHMDELCTMIYQKPTKEKKSNLSFYYSLFQALVSMSAFYMENIGDVEVFEGSLMELFQTFVRQSEGRSVRQSSGRVTSEVLKETSADATNSRKHILRVLHFGLLLADCFFQSLQDLDFSNIDEEIVQNKTKKLGRKERQKKKIQGNLSVKKDENQLELLQVCKYAVKGKYFKNLIMFFKSRNTLLKETMKALNTQTIPNHSSTEKYLKKLRAMSVDSQRFLIFLTDQKTVFGTDKNSTCQVLQLVGLELECIKLIAGIDHSTVVNEKSSQVLKIVKNCESLFLFDGESGFSQKYLESMGGIQEVYRRILVNNGRDESISVEKLIVEIENQAKLTNTETMGEKEDYDLLKWVLVVYDMQFKLVEVLLSLHSRLRSMDDFIRQLVKISLDQKAEENKTPRSTVFHSLFCNKKIRELLSESLSEVPTGQVILIWRDLALNGDSKNKTESVVSSCVDVVTCCVLQEFVKSQQTASKSGIYFAGAGGISGEESVVSEEKEELGYIGVLLTRMVYSINLISLDNECSIFELSDFGILMDGVSSVVGFYVKRFKNVVGQSSISGDVFDVNTLSLVTSFRKVLHQFCEVSSTPGFIDTPQAQDLLLSLVRGVLATLYLDRNCHAKNSFITIVEELESFDIFIELLVNYEKWKNTSVQMDLSVLTLLLVKLPVWLHPSVLIKSEVQQVFRKLIESFLMNLKKSIDDGKEGFLYEQVRELIEVFNSPEVVDCELIMDLYAKIVDEICSEHVEKLGDNKSSLKGRKGKKKSLDDGIWTLLLAFDMGLPLVVLLKSNVLGNFAFFYLREKSSCLVESLNLKTFNSIFSEEKEYLNREKTGLITSSKLLLRFIDRGSYKSLFHEFSQDSAGEEETQLPGPLLMLTSSTHLSSSPKILLGHFKSENLDQNILFFKESITSLISVFKSSVEVFSFVESSENDNENEIFRFFEMSFRVWVFYLIYDLPNNINQFSMEEEKENRVKEGFLLVQLIFQSFTTSIKQLTATKNQNQKETSFSQLHKTFKGVLHTLLGLKDLGNEVRQLTFSYVTELLVGLIADFESLLELQINKFNEEMCEIDSYYVGLLLSEVLGVTRGLIGFFSPVCDVKDFKSSLEGKGDKIIKNSFRLLKCQLDKKSRVDGTLSVFSVLSMGFLRTFGFNKKFEQIDMKCFQNLEVIIESTIFVYLGSYQDERENQILIEDFRVLSGFLLNLFYSLNSMCGVENQLFGQKSEVYLLKLLFHQVLKKISNLDRINVKVKSCCSLKLCKDFFRSFLGNSENISCELMKVLIGKIFSVLRKVSSSAVSDGLIEYCVGLSKTEDIYHFITIESLNNLLEMSIEIASVSTAKNQNRIKNITGLKRKFVSSRGGQNVLSECQNLLTEYSMEFLLSVLSPFYKYMADFMVKNEKYEENKYEEKINKGVASAEILKFILLIIEKRINSVALSSDSVNGTILLFTSTLNKTIEIVLYLNNELQNVMKENNGFTGLKGLYAEDLTKCFHLMNRILANFSTIKSMKKHQHFILATIVNNLSKLPTNLSRKRFREEVYPGLFALLQNCQIKEKNEIYALLDIPGRALMADINDEFNRNFKFVGK